MFDDPFIDSASLSDLRSLLSFYPQLQQIAGAIAEFRVVLDANMAVSDLLHKYKKPDSKQTALEECIKSSVMQVYAPAWLDREMTKSAIPQVARRKNIPESALQDLWIEYRKQLVWDERFPGPEHFPDVEGDIKDVPYVALQECISAAGILSYDKDIEKLGGKSLTLTFVFSVRTYARAATYSVSIYAWGTLISVLALGALCQIIKGVCTSVSKLPDGVKVALLIGAAVAVLHPAPRGKLREFLQNTGALAVGLWPEIERMLELASEKQKEAGSALTETAEILQC